MENSLIFYGGNLAIISFVGYLIYRQTEENKNVKTYKEDTKKLYENKLSSYNKSRHNLLSATKDLFGEKVADNVERKVISIDMPKQLLIVSWGYPNKISESIYKDTRTEKWYYGAYSNRLGNEKYNTEVTLEDGFIVGWKDLN